MYRILIAEGRSRDTELLKECVGNMGSPFEIVGTAATGSQALALAAELKPDIAVLNVNLNEISGLKAAGLLRKIDPGLRIILTSDYDRIEFLKEGLPLDLTDFLLKPLNEGLLVPALRKAGEESKEAGERGQREAEREATLLKYRESAEKAFIYEALFGEGEGLYGYQELLGLGERGCILNVEALLPGWKKRGQWTPHYRNIREIVSEYGRCLIGPRMMQNLIIFVCAGERDEKTEQAHIKDMADKLGRRIEEDTGIEVCIGIGGIRPVPAISESYEEAMLCLQHRGERMVIHIGELKPKRPERIDYWELEDRLMDSIRFGKENSVEYFSKMMDCLAPMGTEELKNKIMEILVLAGHKAAAGEQNESGYIDYRRYFYELEGLRQEEMKTWACRRFAKILRIIQAGRGARRSVAVKEALKYIGEHYRTGLSLEEVSEYVGVTPQHFSKQFKEETGCNFMDYVTELRMEEAKDYLKENELTVKEISYLVGYHDPNYFSRVFKKTVGETPTEYINNNN